MCFIQLLGLVATHHVAQECAFCSCELLHGALLDTSIQSCLTADPIWELTTWPNWGVDAGAQSGQQLRGNVAQKMMSFVIDSLFWQPEAIFDAAAEGDAALLQKVSFLVMLVAL